MESKESIEYGAFRYAAMSTSISHAFQCWRTRGLWIFDAGATDRRRRQKVPRIQLLGTKYTVCSHAPRSKCEKPPSRRGDRGFSGRRGPAHRPNKTLPISWAVRL